ncbi:hypothetical protein [Streptomyces sp. NPDC049915]|uniref:hypothetical protein n=1 Tax=Streptomyces sp. NPDC049915 TaxID=3155510 RepID=UPI00343B00BF
MRNFITLAAGNDLSNGFTEFFKTISATAGGLVTKAIAAVIAVIALRMIGQLINHPQQALKKGSLAIGTLFVAVVVALYGDVLFSTVAQAKG